MGASAEYGGYYAARRSSMSYAPSKSGLMQTASNVAATLTSAYATAGIITDQDDLDKYFKSTQEAVYQDLSAVADTEAESRPASSGGGNRGGGSKNSGGEYNGSIEDAKAVSLTFGAFKGVTLGELFDFTADQCAEYGYEKGNGRKYFEYLGRNDKNPFIMGRAKAIIEDARG